MKLINVFKFVLIFILVLTIQFLLAELSVLIVAWNDLAIIEQSQVNQGIANGSFTLYNLSFWLNVFLFTGVVNYYLYNLKQSHKQANSE